MGKLKILSIPEQIADHLREEINQGKWSGPLPGIKEFARRLDVGITSMEEALRQLEREGLIATQGAGRMRSVSAATASAASARRRLRIAILPYENSCAHEGPFSEAQHSLREAGHDAFFIRTTLLDMGMEVRRVASLVARTEVDAWIVCSAPREIAKWFAYQSKPSFLLFGRRRGLPIASVGPDKSPATIEATRRLLEYGHKRVIMLARSDRRLPSPGAPERAFLATLVEHGLKAPPHYHLPNWDEGRVGFQTRLESLFRVTPPTALIVNELKLFLAMEQFLARKRLLVPEDVSLVCMESDNAFEWCLPPITHIHWDRKPVMRRLVSWANTIAKGKRDIQETNTPAELVIGGTIGPAKH
jgi:DNA-binding LacI/PurR family transcriptional regulator